MSEYVPSSHSAVDGDDPDSDGLSARNWWVTGTDILADETAMRRFCLETVTRFTDSFSSNGIPDTMSGTFRLRFRSDIFDHVSSAPTE